MPNFKSQVLQLKGPILIIGASGFIGSNVLRELLKYRSDVYGSYNLPSPWRLDGISNKNIVKLNICNEDEVRLVLKKLIPSTIFDCSSYGAYSFENNPKKIHETNYFGLINILEELKNYNISSYIHTGTSSEYGDNSNAPSENSPCIANSHYSLSKIAATKAIEFYSTAKLLPILNLRLYYVYGPYEDPSRLFPTLVRHGLEKKLPPLARERDNKDFIFILDVIKAMVIAANTINPSIYGHSFNICTGIKTSLGDLVALASKVFNIKDVPHYNDNNRRAWDIEDWYGNPYKAKTILKWKFETTLESGLLQTIDWWKDNRLNNNDHYTKKI